MKRFFKAILSISDQDTKSVHLSQISSATLTQKHFGNPMVAYCETIVHFSPVWAVWCCFFLTEIMLKDSD
jgi:hypothetical protein